MDNQTVSEWGLSYPLVTFDTITPIPMRTACTDLITPTAQWVDGLRRAEVGELEAFLRHYVPHYGYEDLRVGYVIDELHLRGYYLKAHVIPLVDRLYRGESIKVRNPDNDYTFMIRRVAGLYMGAGGWYAPYTLTGRKIGGGVYRPRYELMQWLDSLEAVE